MQLDISVQGMEKEEAGFLFFKVIMFIIWCKMKFIFIFRSTRLVI